MRKSTVWNIEEGYAKTMEVAGYPLRAFRPGTKNGLFIVLKTKSSDIEYDCSSDENGYRVTISALIFMKICKTKFLLQN